MKDTGTWQSRLWDDTAAATLAKRGIAWVQRACWPWVQGSVVPAVSRWLGRAGQAFFRIGDTQFGAFKLIVGAFLVPVLGLLVTLWLVPRAVVPVTADEMASCQPLRVVGEAGSALRVRPVALARKAGQVAPGQSLLVCSEIGTWSGVVLGGGSGGCLDASDVAARRDCATGWIRSDAVRPAGG